MAAGCCGVQIGQIAPGARPLTIRLGLLDRPLPGRHQAVKAEAAKRERDSTSLYDLRPVRFTAVSSSDPSLIWPHATRASDAIRLDR